MSNRRPDRSSAAGSLAGSVGFDLLGEQLGNEVESALKSALATEAVFAVGNDPLTIFRKTLEASICNIEGDKRGELFQRFLRDGPYEEEGEIPPELSGRRLTTTETAAAIGFIYSFMVNSFKGAVTELLAAAACQRLMQDPRVAGTLPVSARLYVGDAVMVTRQSGKGVLKGADLHVLVVDGTEPDGCSVVVAGVAEVKSGHKSSGEMGGQIEEHLRRARQGLHIPGVDFPSGRVCLGFGIEGRVLRITVQPSDWPLPRTLRFETVEGKRRLMLDPPTPPLNEDQLMPLGSDRWHVSLRWSKEAIAAAAYEMTFWYMEMVGERIYTRKDGEPDPKPKDWQEMDAAAAGRNAVKMMLYYAIRPYAIKDKEGALSKAGARVMQRAIALYNSYGFGYALGMNFRSPAGRREMLWPEDLDEIARSGHNKDGCRLL